MNDFLTPEAPILSSPAEKQLLRYSRAEAPEVHLWKNKPYNALQGRVLRVSSLFPKYENKHPLKYNPAKVLLLMHLRQYERVFRSRKGLIFVFSWIFSFSGNINKEKELT